MANRQVQFKRESVTLDLTSTPYRAIAGSWTNAGRNLEFKVLVQGSTLAEVERYLDDVQRWLTLAQHCDQRLLSQLVHVRTKVCDALTTTAEFGATWLTKPVRAGTLLPGDASESAAGQYSVQATLSLEVAENWRRTTPAPFLEATTFSGLTIRTDGGITSNAVALTARRVTWTSTTGVTVRYRWLAASTNCGFFQLPTTDIAATWDNASKKFTMSDDAGTPNTVLSSAHTFTAGEEVDVVFRWKPGVSMAIWVNGVADGSTPACTFGTHDTPVVLNPTGSHTILSLQIWPAALTDAECAGLAGWGRPETELPLVVLPTTNFNTNCLYQLYNAPGTAPGALRVIVAEGGGVE